MLHEDFARSFAMRSIPPTASTRTPGSGRGEVHGGRFDRKALEQLCSQVAETLGEVLAGQSGDDVLRNLYDIVSVMLAPDRRTTAGDRCGRCLGRAKVSTPSRVSGRLQGARRGCGPPWLRTSRAGALRYSTTVSPCPRPRPPRTTYRLTRSVFSPRSKEPPERPGPGSAKLRPLHAPHGPRSEREEGHPPPGRDCSPATRERGLTWVASSADTWAIR